MHFPSLNISTPQVGNTLWQVVNHFQVGSQRATVDHRQCVGQPRSNQADLAR